MHTQGIFAVQYFSLTNSLLSSKKTYPDYTVKCLDLNEIILFENYSEPFLVISN